MSGSEGNAFVAALVMQAAEHRLKAERARSMMDHYPERTPGPLGATWREIQRHMNKQLEEEARFHEGWAETFDRFVAPFLQAAVEEYVLQELEKLTGPAELLEIQPPNVIETEPLRNFRFLYPPVFPPWPPKFFLGGGI